MQESDRIRYLRQILMPGFGEGVQKKLLNSSVLISGAGGLGSPVSIYLVAAGIGRIIVCDKDTVELSNLNRQILHGTNDIGIAKTESAFSKLRDLNPGVTIQTYQGNIDRASLNKLAVDVDIIADCLDNVSTRMELNRISLEKGIPVIHGGIDGWTAQITLLNPPATPCMYCLFGDSTDTDDPKPVLGAIPGLVGSTQALEIIRYLAGMKENLMNQLLYFDGLKMEWTKMKLQKNKDCEVCSDY